MIDRSDIAGMTTAQLLERKRLLCSFKHKASPRRRITRIERELGAIRSALAARQNANMQRGARWTKTC
jgi:hypothetical protein